MSNPCDRNQRNTNDTDIAKDADGHAGRPGNDRVNASALAICESGDEDDDKATS